MNVAYYMRGLLGGFMSLLSACRVFYVLYSMLDTRHLGFVLHPGDDGDVRVELLIVSTLFSASLVTWLAKDSAAILS